MEECSGVREEQREIHLGELFVDVRAGVLFGLRKFIPTLQPSWRCHILSPATPREAIK